jgi:hypothetical protein
VALQHFFVDGRHLGSRLIPTNRLVPGLDVRPHHSYALFCMRCGEIWGRLMHEAAPLTQIICRPCLKHGDGSLSWLHDSAANINESPLGFADDWPSAAIRHEFRAYMAHAEKESRHGL